MARSYRDSRYNSVCFGTDTKDRRAGARRLRRINRVRVNLGLFPLLRREVDDNWGWPSDGGKRYRPSNDPRDSRK